MMAAFAPPDTMGEAARIRSSPCRENVHSEVDIISHTARLGAPVIVRSLDQTVAQLGKLPVSPFRYNHNREDRCQ